MAENGRIIRRDISVGSIITIVTVVSGLGFGWAQFKSNLEYQERRISVLEAAAKERQAARIDEVRLIAEIRGELKYLREVVQAQTRAQLRSRGG